MVGILGAVAFAVDFVAGWSTQWGGAFLAVSLGGIGAALVWWGHRLLREPVAVQEREPLASDPEERRAALEAFDAGEVLERRPALRRMLLAAGAALGLAALFPFRSLGPRPRRTHPWRTGTALVDASGDPIAVDAVPRGSLLTAFPKGHESDPDGPVVVMRVAPDQIHAPPGRADWSPDGLAGVLEDLHPRRLSRRALPVRVAHPAVPLPPVAVRRAARGAPDQRPGCESAPAAAAPHRRRGRTWSPMVSSPGRRDLRAGRTGDGRACEGAAGDGAEGVAGGARSPTAAVGCGNDTTPSTLNPAGSQADRLATLWWILLIMATVVFVVVGAFIAYAALSRRRGNPGGWSDHRFIVVGGVAVPFVILSVVAALTVVDSRDLANAGTGKPVHIEVIGRRWWWEVRYPDTGFVTANEMRVPVGRPIELTVRSDDVIHSFWVPQLAGKTDTIPGQPNHMVFDVSRPGTYFGNCAEFCGIQHTNMAVVVVALTQPDFTRWEADHARPPDAVRLRPPPGRRSSRSSRARDVTPSPAPPPAGRWGRTSPTSASGTRSARARC